MTSLESFPKHKQNPGRGIEVRKMVRAVSITHKGLSKMAPRKALDVIYIKVSNVVGGWDCDDDEDREEVEGE